MPARTVLSAAVLFAFTMAALTYASLCPASAEASCRRPPATSFATTGRCIAVTGGAHEHSDASAVNSDDNSEKYKRRNMEK
jgi:hypothetical protein